MYLGLLVRLGKPLFLYNEDGTICYFEADKESDIVNKLGIHKSTFDKHLEKGTLFLDKYLLSTVKIPNAILTDMTVYQIRAMLDIDRINYNKIKPLVPNSCNVTLVNVQTKEVHSFPSLRSATTFLKGLSYSADRRTLAKYLNTGNTYYGFTCHKQK